MTKEQLDKSISLIGPASVGKSLLSEELSKKLNIPAINFDTLFVLIKYEKEGLLSEDPEVQKEFFNRSLEDVANDDKLFRNVMQENLAKEMQLIKNFINTYNRYREILGDFRPLYDVYNYQTYLENSSISPLELNFLLNNISLRVMKYIVSTANTPIIFDLPAPFGWEISNEVTKYALQKKLNNTPLKHNPKTLNKDIHNLINKTYSVLLTPGEDYAIRSAAKHSNSNDLILDKMDGYTSNTDIEITTNGLFNNPNNPAFKSRLYFDAINTATRERLRNDGLINNMCDEIIERISELSLGEK